MEIGLLLPHFSEYSTWDRLIGFAPRIEALGFDSVWVRDNLGYYQHDFELPGTRLVDPFITLATVAGCTQRVRLGTAVVIPWRHPVVTAQLFGSLWFTARGRVEVGLGPGTPTKPYEVTGIPFENRIRLCKETAEVLRRLALGTHVSYEGEFTRFQDVTIDPSPPPSELRIWYGGATNASVRRILDYCDGILPGRCPFRRYDVAVEQLRQGGAEQGRRIWLGTIPNVTLGRSREEALAKANVGPLLEYLQGHWKMPFETPEDAAGAIVAGTPSQVVEQIQAFVDRDVDVMVIDLRMQMPEFEDVVEQFAAEVLPAFRGQTAAIG